MQVLDFLPLIYLCVGLTGAFFIGRLLLNHSTQLRKVKRGIEVQKQKKSIENGIEDLLDNAPTMYAKVLQELEYLKQNGADQKQMGSLQNKADLLKKVVDNKEIIDLAGKPIIKWVSKFAGGFGR